MVLILYILHLSSKSFFFCDKFRKIKNPSAKGQKGWKAKVPPNRTILELFV
jgi:hypothetical protein